MNKILKWVTGLLVAAVLVKGVTVKDWSREAALLQKVAGAGMQFGFQILLKSRYPAAARPEAAITLGRDPSYKIYQKYRYAYEKYGYLFLAGNENRDGQPDGSFDRPGWVNMVAGGAGSGTGMDGQAMAGGEAGAAGQVAAGGAVGQAMGGGADGQVAAGGEAGADGQVTAGNQAGLDGGQAGTEGQSGADGPVTGTGQGEAAQPSGATALAAGVSYSLEQLMDYDFLMKHFYSVHSSTTAGRNVMNAETFLSKDMRLVKDPSVPQILIYHTHTQETYADYGPENKEASVIGIGNYLTSLLQQKGWNVIHDTTTYDIKSGKLDRNRAYTYALDGITAILQENPSIQVILDLHRDGVRENVHLVSEVNGKPTSQVMFFQGMSRTPDGAIEYLPNPYLEDNLAFAFQMQLGAAGRYPGLTRKIYLKGLRYNLHLRPRSALIEVGAQNNSYEEARNAMEPLAELLDMVLQGN